MCLCMPLYIHTCPYVPHLYMLIYAYIWLYMSRDARICLICLDISMHTYNICLYIYMFVYVYICLNMIAYAYIYPYMPRVYMPIYAYMSISASRRAEQGKAEQQGIPYCSRYCLGIPKVFLSYCLGIPQVLPMFLKHSLVMLWLFLRYSVVFLSVFFRYPSGIP